MIQKEERKAITIISIIDFAFLCAAAQKYIKTL